MIMGSASGEGMTRKKRLFDVVIGYDSIPNCQSWLVLFVYHFCSYLIQPKHF